METITPKLLDKVKALVKSGATVVGPRPLRSPSLSNYPRADAEVERMARDLWGDCDGIAKKEHRYGKGRVVWDAAIAQEKTPEQADSLETAKWIWHNEGRPAEQAPVGKRFFKRTLVLPVSANVVSASISVTADNQFELWVNGRRAGSGNNFHETTRFDIGRWLKPGTNVLAVAAENGGSEPNPAGLIAAGSVKLRDAQVIHFVTDGEWRTSSEAPPKWTASPPGATWEAALELGPTGMGRGGRSVRPLRRPTCIAILPWSKTS